MANLPFCFQNWANEEGLNFLYCSRNLIVKKLESFDGFDAGGFAKLNKGLLPTIATNFITYLIILIQTKLEGR